MEGVRGSSPLSSTRGCWLEIDSRYDRKKWGLRGMVIEPHIRQEASTDPTKVGFILSLLGVESPMNKLDSARSAGPPTNAGQATSGSTMASILTCDSPVR